jgi:membrane protein CcdC involved in cytochrome C biogenesis
MECNVFIFIFCFALLVPHRLNMYFYIDT